MRWFTAAEYRCPCRRPDCDAPQEFAVVLAERLDMLRDSLGRPLVVTSGLRCAAHNAAVGGTRTSRHLTGHAVDLACPTDAERAQLLRHALIRPAEWFPFIELAPRHVHLDVESRGVPLVMLGGG